MHNLCGQPSTTIKKEPDTTQVVKRESNDLTDTRGVTTKFFCGFYKILILHVFNEVDYSV